MTRTTSLLLLAFLSLGAYKSHGQQVNTNRQKSKMMQTENETSKQGLLTSRERDYAIKSLTRTRSGVLKAVKGLNEAQLTYKSSADKWNVEECVKHIAAAETNLWMMVEASLKQPANPNERAGIKLTDEKLIEAVEDRSQKSKTFTALEPANSPYKTFAEALAAFEDNRGKLLEFVRSTREDLRNHVSVLPIGTYDAYQFILLISAHSNRHTQQIEEVKGGSDFPKR